MSTTWRTTEESVGMAGPTELGATKLRDIMTTDVLTLAKDQTFREAIEALSESGVAGGPVVSGSRIVGVISTTDILDFAAAITPLAGRQCVSKEFRSLPDEDEDAPAVFYTDVESAVEADVLKGLATDTPDRDLLNEYTIDEVMTRKLAALPPDADVTSASKMMLHLGIHRVLVMEHGELQGIVSTRGILGLVARRG